MAASEREPCAQFRAVIAAKSGTGSRRAMFDDAKLTMIAPWGQRLDGTRDALETRRLSVGNHLHGLFIAVPTGR